MIDESFRPHFKALETAKKIAEVEQSGLTEASKIYREREENKMGQTEMPEEMWLQYDKGTVYIGSPWARGHATEYRLKSTEDKTIRELAAAIDKAAERFSVLGYIECVKEAKQALSDNAPRIAEAQENKQ